MMRIVALAMACLVTAPAQAAVLDDFLSRGYTIVASTRWPGSFGGCVRQQRLVFADGSAFACARTQAQTAYEPHVYMLRLGGDPPSVVLVGSAVLAGQLLRLRSHDYPVPLRMDAAPLPELHSPPGRVIQPLGPIASINTVTSRQNAPLARQQEERPGNPPVRQGR